MIPEAKIKKLVRELFKAKNIRNASEEPNTGDGWYYMPIQNGLGVKGIPDFVGHYKGLFFAVETKAPGKKPTGWQAMVGRSLMMTGAEWFVVDGEVALDEVKAWMEVVSEDYKQPSRI